MKKTLKRTQIKVNNENKKEKKEMNKLTLFQQKVLHSDSMIRNDINNDNDNNMDPLLQITNVSINDTHYYSFHHKKMIITLIYNCSFLHKELKAVSINKT